jgi:hypothetical protein
MSASLNGSSGKKTGGNWGCFLLDAPFFSKMRPLSKMRLLNAQTFYDTLT